MHIKSPKLFSDAFAWMLVLSAPMLLRAQSASPVSVTPSSGSGSAQLFTVTLSDPNGGADVAEGVLNIMANVVPGTSGWSANECLLRYDIATNDIWQVPNAGGTWSGPVTAGSSASLSNSQCTVLASGSSAQFSGGTVTINFLVQFSNGFTGARQLYLEGEDIRGNWSTNYTQQFGSFTVQSVASPQSITPTVSEGQATQDFTAAYYDPLGGSAIAEGVLDIMTNNVVPGTSGWSANQCLLRYDFATNDIWLVPNAGGAWSGPIVAGSSATLSNSQCSVLASGSGASVSGTTATAHFAVSFTSSFATAKQLYLEAENTSGSWSSNYQQPFAGLTQPPMWSQVMNPGDEVAYFKYQSGSGCAYGQPNACEVYFGSPGDDFDVPPATGFGGKNPATASALQATKRPPASYVAVSGSGAPRTVCAERDRSSVPVYYFSCGSDVGNGTVFPTAPNDEFSVSENLSGLKGLEFEGSFLGSGSVSSPGSGTVCGTTVSGVGSIVEAVFYTQRACTDADFEYGFTRTVLSSAPVSGASADVTEFYYSIDTNCGFIGDTGCSSTTPSFTGLGQTTRQYYITGLGNDSQGQNLWIYHAYPTPAAPGSSVPGGLAMRFEIIDPYTFAYAQCQIMNGPTLALSTVSQSMGNCAYTANEETSMNISSQFYNVAGYVAAVSQTVGTVSASSTFELTVDTMKVGH